MVLSFAQATKGEDRQSDNQSKEGNQQAQKNEEQDYSGKKGDVEAAVRSTIAASLFILVLLSHIRLHSCLNVGHIQNVLRQRWSWNWRYEVSILIVIVVVIIVPVSSADIAKLMLAEAGHMIASLKLIYKCTASWTLTVSQRLFEELQLKSITASFVSWKQASAAELSIAYIAAQRIIIGAKCALTSFARTESQRRIINGCVEPQNSSVFCLNVCRQRIEEGRISLQFELTATAGATNLAKLFNCVYCVMLQARLAKQSLMFTVGDEHFLVDLDILLTNLAMRRTAEFPKEQACLHDHRAILLRRVWVIDLVILDSNDFLQGSWSPRRTSHQIRCLDHYIIGNDIIRLA